MTVDLAQLLVRRLLENPMKLEWSCQGFGMLRHYLSKEVRLHVWDPTRAVENVSVIHDHPWDFESVVVCGQVENVLYAQLVREQSGAGWVSEHGGAVANGPETHSMQQIVCGVGGHSLGTPAPVRLMEHSRVVYTPSMSYSSQHDWLHESLPEPGTVTLVTRRFLADTEHARVCFPLGTEWVSAEPRKATDEEVDHFTTLALDRLSEVL